MPACNKHSYPTPIAAALVLRRIKMRKPARGEVGIHPCRVCHAWHLTSKADAARNRWTVTALESIAH